VTDAQAPLLVLGTRPFSAEIADLAGDAGYEVVGFVENLSRERCDDTLEGLPIHWIDELGDLVATHLAVCGLGTTRRSIFVEQAADRGLRFATVIHPTARVSRTSSIGEGSIVSAGVTVASHAVVGRHVLLNRGALVGHHTVVGDYASIMAGANVAGHCRIGEQVFLGMGSIVIDHISVGPGSVVGAGAVVTKDVPGSVEVIGVPARIAKEGIEAR
jgi:sugar O-acyltransferase (sialic acid O-acetyltransferase NeuD family)